MLDKSRHYCKKIIVRPAGKRPPQNVGQASSLSPKAAPSSSRKPSKRPRVLAAILLALTSLPSVPVEFKAAIQPIFEKHCYQCHGPSKQKNGLRLDRKAAALTGGESGPAIVPGKSADSLLIRLVTGLDADRVMPQKGDRLSEEQIGLLRTWIDAGAAWPEEVSADPRDWWSLKRLVRPAIPVASQQGRNPIDAFMLAKLTQEGLLPAPEAGRRTLIRRLYFDLVGLPPTPEEVSVFEKDEARDAYERVVDRLLASPRHGERWARHWMDVAHFAETHGHDQDRIREHAWPYRDYLIESFNADKPYARFVEEQIAGDALCPEDPKATVALGFLAAGPWDESSLRDIREDTIDRQIGRYLDRDDIVTTVMQTFASSAVQCARCHDHKFDPISQREYYGLQAVFAGVDKANRRYDANAATRARRAELQKQLLATRNRDRRWLSSEAVQCGVRQWEAARTNEARWRLVEPETLVSTGGATLTRQKDGSLLSAGVRPDKDTNIISWNAGTQSISAVRLEVLSDDSLPKGGPGRQDNGNLHLTEVELSVFENAANTGRVVKLQRPTSDFDQDGWTIAHAIDANEKTAWGIFPKVGETHEAVFELRDKVIATHGGRFTLVLKQLHGGGHIIGRLRVSTTDATPESAFALPARIRNILATESTKRSEEDRLDLAAFQQQHAIEREVAALPTQSLVYAAASEFDPDGGLKPTAKPRKVHVLRRGDVRRPREEAPPGALECVANLPAKFSLADVQDEASRRVALARWLTDAENPLVWRSIVNRVWHYHFGGGIVDTPNDFGRMGGAPTHPELLDWLATWFRDNGGSLKQLQRLIVTSATYCQRSDVPKVARDTDNRLLSRMNRTRLDAECVRDSVLAAADRLDLRMGGPSDRQFDLQPGIHVTPKIDYAKFDIDSPAGARRSVYRFLFRTLPDPMMDALDCPAGDQAAAVRNASITVQQALALWNSEFIARHSEHLAERLQQHYGDVQQQVRSAFELTLCRGPNGDELREFTSYGREHGMAGVCRLLFNSNEFLFVD